MRLRPLAVAFSIAFVASPAAWAQMQLTSSSASGLGLESMSLGLGRYLTMRNLPTGLKVGEDSILHAGVFSDIGYDSNVFYSNSNQKTAAVLHVTPRLELTNAERDGSIPQGTYYNLAAAVDWREYLSGDSAVKEQRAFSPSVGGTAEFSSGQALSLTLSEAFSRTDQPPYQEGASPIIRDDNMASASLKFAPGGGRLRVMARYSNLIDVYEGAQYKSGSNMGNELVLDFGWRWLPRTTIYAQVAQGAITYLESNSGRSYSLPLRTLLGLRGLLTEKLAVNLGAGYVNSFYSTGPNTSGLGNLTVVAELNYAVSLLSRAGIGYRHDFANSPFVGQFYNLDAVYGAFQQMIAGRVATYVYARYENRRFIGGASRTDNFVMGGVSLDYKIRDFFLAGASYALTLNQSSGAASNGGIDYAKHVVLFRLGLVY